MTKMTLMTSDVMFFCCHCLKSLAVKPLTKSASRRLWWSPGQLSRWKGLDCHPRTSFCAGMMCQSTPPPQSASPNGSESGKTSRHPSFSPSFAPIDVLLCQRVKMDLANLSLSQESFMTSCDGFVWTIIKDEFADALGVNCCKMYVQISHDQANKSPQIMEFLKWFVFK
jgi:hypothetical protein